MMKTKILSYCLFLITLVTYSKVASAQTFGNEWINYNQSYLKFAVAEDGIFRINGAQLSAAGLTGATGSNIQVFRDGNQIPIYTSVTGAITAANFIEFYGRKGDGEVDKPLFKDQSNHMNPSQNLISDTAYYFVTTSASGPHLRYNLLTNTISGSPLKETFCWDEQNINFRGALSQGPSYIGQNQNPILYLRSSQFERAEGWVKTFTANDQTHTVSLNNPYTTIGGPSATLKTTVAGFSYLTNHRVQLEANGNLFADSTFGAFTSKDFNVAIPMSIVNSSDQVALKYSPLNSIPSSNLFDRIGIANINIRYPRTFDFNNENHSYFELNPKLTNYYLEIDNFNNGSVAPVLYDLSSQQYLVGNISVAGKVRFLIPASSAVKRFVLISRSGAAYKSVSDLKQITFKNYSLAANQGDYLIISDPHFFDDGSGNNNVNAYRSFRASAIGGNYNAIVVDVNDVYNEFGYGYPFHAQGLKNFLHFATKNTAWSNNAKFAFLIGKGITYPNYNSYAIGRDTNPTAYPYVPLPTFGIPASDIMLTDFNMDNAPELPLGRLSVLNGGEIKPYLDKAIAHETHMADGTKYYSDSILWRKKVLHIAGGSDVNLSNQIKFYLNRQREIIHDTCYGAFVELVSKSSSAPVQQIASAKIDELINDGVGLIQYFGHGSSQTLEFNLDNPENYLNAGRFPIFIANGCGVGNVFSLNSVKTLSERWLNAPNAGCINFIANTNTGFTNSLALYSDSLYGQAAKFSYGKTVGEVFHNNADNMLSQLNFLNDNVFRFHAEQMLLQGDPAISIYGDEKPDYAIEEKSVTFRQLSVTTNMDSFDVDIIAFNLGKYTTDSVDLTVTRTLPDNTQRTVFTRKYPGIAFTDTISFRISVGGDAALGDNQLNVSIDNALVIDEMTEMNNNIQKSFTVFNDDLVPVYPYEFSIVSEQGAFLKASTLNPFLGYRQYVFQIDTTEQFNSSSLITHRTNSSGGVIKWQPTMTFVDSTVYYWRTAMDTIYGNNTHRWSNSSFIYLNQSLPGWSQSHYYQYAKDDYENISIQENDRVFRFTSENNKLQVQNVCYFGPAPYAYSGFDYLTKVNGVTISLTGSQPSNYASLQFIVIDSITGEPWMNSFVSPRFGSYPTPFNLPAPHFEFNFTTPVWRQRIMNFLDSIPNGAYVMMQTRLCLGGGSGACGVPNSRFVDQWKTDTTTLGSGNSLYHKLQDFGFTQIDSFTKNRPMIFFMQKGLPNTVQQHFGADSTVKLYKEFDFRSYLTDGNIVSTKIGPASMWSHFYRDGFTSDATMGDSVAVNIIGIDSAQNEVLLATVYGDTSLSFIDANEYSCIKLSMQQRDTIYTTPEQIKYWRVHYQPVPEAALNPNRHFAFVDSMGQGQVTNVEIAIENLTDIPMDSMLVDFALVDVNNNSTQIAAKRYRPLPALDTIIATVPFSSESFGGNYLFKIEANPNNDQIEQFHPNNVGYKAVHIESDNKNPILDVTFDGVHILNRDIVSSKPNILITLKDENKFLALDDTTVMQVSLRYPDQPNIDVPIPYDNNILTFIPAVTSTLGVKNEAKIEFKPTFLEDGLYELVLEGKDKSGNESGKVSYTISFNVVNQEAISAVMNYPNPFSSSTQFVFTITGSQVPTNFKIQILNMSGRVVKEITKAELGNLHIGRNITSYRWKGDDQYGDLLGNGVYLFRVVSSINGERMENYDIELADKWIEKGYGKLYIMR